jgi:hypothetical protein
MGRPVHHHAQRHQKRRTRHLTTGRTDARGGRVDDNHTTAIHDPARPGS